MELEIQIDKGCVLSQFQGDNKEAVIKELSERFKKLGNVTNDFEEAVLKREQIYPTGLKIGKYNIAIPHTEPQYVNKACMGIATLKHPISFQRMDVNDELVDVDVVLLLALNQSHTHVEILSRIIRMCQDESIIASLIQAKNEQEIVDIISNRLIGGNENE